eukprot:2853501-Rhodomonas_salina.4
MKDSGMYFWNGLCLLCAWFFVRIVFGFSSSYFFWQDTAEAYNNETVAVPIMVASPLSPRPHPLHDTVSDRGNVCGQGWYCFSNISLNCLNVMWFIQIVKGALRAVGGGKKAAKE